MNKKIKLIGLMLLILNLPLQLNAQAEVLTTTIGSGILDDISKADQSVVFNGKKYKYTIKEKVSSLAVGESEPIALNIRDLKVGEKYYFETISYKKEPTKEDFKEVIFITDIKPMVLE